MQIKQSEIQKLVGSSKPMSNEELQDTAAIRVNIAGMHDGDVVEFPDKLDVYPFIVRGNTTPIVIAKVNKTPARFFLSTFMNQGYPVIARGSEKEIAELPLLKEGETPNFLKDSKNENVVLANEGEVCEEWKKASDLRAAVDMLQGKKIRFREIEWIMTMFQKRRRFEITWA